MSYSYGVKKSTSNSARVYPAVGKHFSEKELKEIDEMQSMACGTKVKEEIKEQKPKSLKLTFKEKIALEKLPKEIDELEIKIEEKNNCLANPTCYEDIGLSKLAKELADLEELYEKKVEELLTIQEKEELINS